LSVNVKTIFDNHFDDDDIDTGTIDGEIEDENKDTLTDND